MVELLPNSRNILMFIWLVGQYGLRGWEITETPIARNFEEPLDCDLVASEEAGNLLPEIEEKLIAAFSITSPFIDIDFPPPPCLRFQISAFR